jgi:anti-sigma regulatory factor (Ser/Thr protein kinase)
MAGVGSESRTSLPCVPASAGKARRFVRSVLSGVGSSELSEVAELLVSELASNAILHAGTDLEVVVRVMPDRVSVEVHDRGPGTATRRHYSATSGTGRGLVLVEELARHWGTVVTADGKFVWFELAIPNGVETAGAAPAATG